MHVSAHGYKHVSEDILGGQKRALDPLETELQVVVRCLLLELGTELMSSVRAV